MGDALDIEAVFRRHVKTVYRVCYSFMGSAADAEDATQATFMRLIDHPRTFESEQHEKAWLIVCASNVCKDVLKQYAESGPDTLDTILYCMKKEDWKNYTVKVHALKSSSRLAGLDTLSEAAARLGAQGHIIQDSQPGNPHYEEARAEIQSKTPVLMEQYKALILALTEAL